METRENLTLQERTLQKIIITKNDERERDSRVDGDERDRRVANE